MLSDVLCEFTKSIGMETNMYAQLGGKLSKIVHVYLRRHSDHDRYGSINFLKQLHQ